MKLNNTKTKKRQTSGLVKHWERDKINDHVKDASSWCLIIIKMVRLQIVAIFQRDRGSSCRQGVWGGGDGELLFGDKYKHDCIIVDIVTIVIMISHLPSVPSTWTRRCTNTSSTEGWRSSRATSGPRKLHDNLHQHKKPTKPQKFTMKIFQGQDVVT